MDLALYDVCSVLRGTCYAHAHTHTDHKPTHTTHPQTTHTHPHTRTHTTHTHTHTHTNTEYELLISFPRQKYLHERASIPRCTLILSLLFECNKSVHAGGAVIITQSCWYSYHPDNTSCKQKNATNCDLLYDVLHHWRHLYLKSSYVRIETAGSAVLFDAVHRALRKGGLLNSWMWR